MAVTYENAIKLIKKEFASRKCETELLPIENAVGRTIACDIRSSEGVPFYDHANFCGYALCFEDTLKASCDSPVRLAFKGSVEAGCGARFSISNGEYAFITSGGDIPAGANAIVRCGDCCDCRDGFLTVFRPILRGENIVERESDIQRNSLMIKKGQTISIKDVCVFAALGIVFVKVYKMPRIGIVAIGDELVMPAVTPTRGEMRDITSYNLAANITALGGTTKLIGICKNNETDLRHAIKDSATSFDLVIVAGSSCAIKKVVDIASEMGRNVFNGIAMSPGEFASLSVVCQTPLLCMPNTPFGVFVFSKLFILPIIGLMTDQNVEAKSVTAIYKGNLLSDNEKDIFIPVNIRHDHDILIADPVKGKIKTLLPVLSANGFVRICRATAQLNTEQLVRAFPFE